MDERLPGQTFNPESSDVPVAGAPQPRPAKKTKPATKAGAEEIGELREEISQTREDLGQTVEALTSKADVKARVHEKADEVKANAQETVGQVRSSTQEGFAAARTRAVRLGSQAKQAAQNPENAGKVKGGGAAAAGTAALGAVVWGVRRRRNRPKTPWEKTAYALGQAGGIVRDRAAEYSGALLNSDQVAQAAKTGRRAAKKAAKQARKAAPEATPRRKGGAVVVLGTIAGLAVAYRVINQNSEEPKP